MLQNLPEEGLGKEVETLQTIAKNYLESVIGLVICFPRVMSLKHYMHSRYGNSSGALVTSYGKCLEKLSRFKNHVAFSARCKREGVLPPSLSIRPPIDTTKGWEIAERASRQFLSERLRVANYRRNQLEEEAKWREIGLKRILEPTDFEKVKRISEDHAEKVFMELRDRQQNKFSRIACSVGNPKRRNWSKNETKKKDFTADKTLWVLNFSKQELSRTQRTALEKGMNFSERSTTIPRATIIAGVEAALRKARDVRQADRARATVASILSRSKPPRPNTSREERKALEELRKNKDIVILPADKGTSVVILDKEEYDRKAMDILQKAPFKKLQKDPTRRNENRVNDRLRRLLSKGAIDKNTFQQLRVSVNGSRPPLFYGCVKIHKPERPLRPIVSAVGSATYDLAKFVSRTLAPYVKECRSYLANTSDFVRKLAPISIKTEEIIVSFDVKSLFTSVPVDDAISAIREIVSLDEDFEQRSCISVDTLEEMLRICLVSTNFQFRDEYYELTDGLAMGSPLSPAVANLFMAKLEEKALSTFTNAPKTWFRFVDDVFSIIRKVDVEAFLAHLNQQHPSIRFTIEKEEDGTLPFLDTRVHRCEGGSLRTSIYRKPTHTGSYLHFESNHPLSAKRSVVASLLNRVENITLGDSEKEKEENRVRKELESNGYPQSFITNTKKRLLKKRTQQACHASNIPQEKKKIVSSIPYVPGVTEAITRVLAPLGIQTVSKAAHRKWSLMGRAKDHTPADTQPGVVYALGCQDCPQVYVGETARTAKQRVKEHQEHMKKGNENMSAVAHHVLETGHAIHWKAKVLRKETETVKRKVHEALLINKLQKREGCKMNLDHGMELSNIWLEVMEQQNTRT